MKKLVVLGFVGLSALGFAACGSSESDEVDASVYLPDAAVAAKDAMAPDTQSPDTVPAAPVYVNVVIVDTEAKQPAADRAACGNGPGSDIDAIELIRATVPVGYGLAKSSDYRALVPPYCAETDCSGNACKYALSTLAPQTEGKKDAKVNATTNDVGYFSLNGGTLYLQFGDATGAGAAQAIKKGDQIKVYEVDQSYIASKDAFAGCTCAPEHYEVWLQDALGTPETAIRLVPAKFEDENAAVCGTASVSGLTQGCGTTTFIVP